MRITLLDACYLHGGHRSASATATPTRWAERVDALAERRAGADRRGDPQRARGRPGRGAGRRRVGRAAGRCTRTSPSSPRRTRTASPRTARTPTALLADAGALARRFTAIHATHLTDDDVALLGGAARRSASARRPSATSPTASARRAALARRGRARSPPARDSHAVIDLFEEARAIELDERLATGVRGAHRAADAPRAPPRPAATRALGWPEGGPHRGRARSPTSRRLRSTPCGSRARAPSTRPRASCSRRPPPTSAT